MYICCYILQYVCYIFEAQALEVEHTERRCADNQLEQRLWEISAHVEQGARHARQWEETRAVYLLINQFILINKEIRIK